MPITHPEFTAQPGRKLWTLEECRALGEKELPDWDRHELIEGAIIQTSGKTWARCHARHMLFCQLCGTFGFACLYWNVPVQFAGTGNELQ